LRIEEATLAADGWYWIQPKEVFLDGLKKFEQQGHNCVELWSKYIFSNL
jgi:isocitrate dehydrogenase kinase/phosphatase